MPGSFMDWLPPSALRAGRGWETRRRLRMVSAQGHGRAQASARMRGSRRLWSLKDTVRSWFLEFPQNPDRVSSVRGWSPGRDAHDHESGRPDKECSAGLFRSLLPIPYSFFLFYAVFVAADL